MDFAGLGSFRLLCDCRQTPAAGNGSKFKINIVSPTGLLVLHYRMIIP
jgi:hypothetical protein